MQKFAEIGIILTLLIISVNVHIMQFHDVADPDRSLTIQSFSLVAKFEKKQSEESADYNVSQIEALATEEATTDNPIVDVRSGGLITLIPWLPEALAAAGFMLDLAILGVIAYTAVLSEILPVEIVTVIAAILTPIQLLTMLYMLVWAASSLKKSIPFA